MNEDEIPSFQEAQNLELEFEEIDLELDDECLIIAQRLVKEGFFESLDESVSFAVQHSLQKEDKKHDFGEINPDMGRRISELRQISYSAENDYVARFFADATYVIQEFGREVHDGQIFHQMDEGSKVQEASEHMSSVNYVLSPDRDPETAAIFLDNTRRYAEELMQEAEQEYRKEFASDFMESYFSDDEVYEKLSE